MSLYCIYLPDGSIRHSTKVYDPDGLKYDEQLKERGETFITVPESPGLLPPDLWYVHTGALELRERPIMSNVRIDKTRIKCDDKDTSITSGIPTGTRILVIMFDGTIINDAMSQGPLLEITLPVECTVRVILQKWPYRDFIYEIEGVLQP